MNEKLTNLIDRVLPEVSTSSISYNRDRNMFLTTGWTSGLGHTYFQGIQLSNRIAIICSIGRGGYGSNPLFLNRVDVYCFNGTKKQIIGSWHPVNWDFYSDYLAHRVAKDILVNYLKGQMRLQGCHVCEKELLGYAEAQINAATSNMKSLTA